MNTPQGTVKGQVEGNRANVDLMYFSKLPFINIFRKLWLQTTGSPQSKIDRCDFVEYSISELGFKNFDITR
jgi:hypothetical protein